MIRFYVVLHVFEFILDIIQSSHNAGLIGCSLPRREHYGEMIQKSGKSVDKLSNNSHQGYDPDHHGHI